jgi:hypothetical protein
MPDSQAQQQQQHMAQMQQQAHAAQQILPAPKALAQTASTQQPLAGHAPGHLVPEDDMELVLDTDVVFASTYRAQQSHNRFSSQQQDEPADDDVRHQQHCITKGKTTTRRRRQELHLTLQPMRERREYML